MIFAKSEPVISVEDAEEQADAHGGRGDVVVPGVAPGQIGERVRGRDEEGEGSTSTRTARGRRRCARTRR